MKHFRVFIAALALGLATTGFAAGLDSSMIITLLQRNIGEESIKTIIFDCKMDAPPTADEFKAISENGAAPALIDTLLSAEAYGAPTQSLGYYGIYPDGKIVRIPCGGGYCPPEDVVFLTDAPVAVQYEAPIYHEEPVYYEEPVRQHSSTPGFLRWPLLILTSLLSAPNVETSYYDDDDDMFGAPEPMPFPDHDFGYDSGPIVPQPPNTLYDDIPGARIGDMPPIWERRRR